MDKTAVPKSVCGSMHIWVLSGTLVAVPPDRDGASRAGVRIVDDGWQKRCGIRTVAIQSTHAYEDGLT